MTIKFGVIGTGTISQEHSQLCNTLLHDEKVVTVSDISVEGTYTVLKYFNFVAEVYHIDQSLESYA